MSVMPRACFVFTATLAAVMAFGTAPLQAQTRTHVPVRKTVTCHSNNHEYQRCNVHRWQGIELIRQSSRTPCVRGDNWGREGEWMWVSGGCRGEFAEVRHGYAPGYRHPARIRGSVREGYSVSCASNGNEFKRCNVGPWDDAVLLKQESRTRCVRGDNWDLDGIAIWVSNGCRGVFAEVRRHDRRDNRDRRPARHGRRPVVDSWNRDIRFACASRDQQRKFCAVDVGRRGLVEIEEQQSSADCVLDQSWGWNRAGIWVTKGCRAKFVVHRQR